METIEVLKKEEVIEVQMKTFQKEKTDKKKRENKEKKI